MCEDRELIFVQYPIIFLVMQSKKKAKPLHLQACVSVHLQGDMLEVVILAVWLIIQF